MSSKRAICWVMTLGLAMAGLTATATTAPARIALPNARTAAASAPPSGWLGAVNWYRARSGVAPVTENKTWTDGLVKHFRYLHSTSPSLLTGPYASMHTENPASPWYTPEGAAAGGSSDLAGAYGATGRQAIEVWMVAPFHAIGILRPGLRQSAFASAYGFMGLDVIRGLTGTPNPRPTVLFPGNGATNFLTSFGGENPDPHEACNKASVFAGLPIIAMLPAAPPAGTTATLTTPTGRHIGTGPELCVVTANNYVSSDPVYGPTGRAILQGDNAVFVMPKVPLAGGHYAVTINLPGRPSVTWSFNQAIEPGYWMVDTSGYVYPFGGATNFGYVTTSKVSHIEPTPTKGGYWIVNQFGEVFAFGDAIGFGNAPIGLYYSGEPVSSMSATPTGHGYWLFTSKGRALPFGDARSYGDMSHTPLNGPIVGSVSTPTGKGYYMVASDGGIFAFGDAHFHGSMGGQHLNRPVNGLVPIANNRGYWLVASDGGIFAFNAPFRGSMGGAKLNRPIIGVVRYGNGYLMVASDGGIFNFSNQPFSGSLGSNPPLFPIVSVATIG